MVVMKVPSTVALAFCFLSLGQSARAQACGDYLGYYIQCEPNPIDLPSFSTTDPSSSLVYEVKANEVVGQQFGFLLYGYHPGSRPFLGGDRE